MRASTNVNGAGNEEIYLNNWLVSLSLAVWYACVNVCSAKGMSTTSRRGLETLFTMASTSVSNITLNGRRCILLDNIHTGHQEALPSIYGLVHA